MFLLLGSNLGDRAIHLTNARSRIESDIGQIFTTSSIYSTAPWGIANQPDFYNQVVQLHTPLSPQKVLHHALSIEEALGRVRKEKWGPRIIDIDLLFYNEQVLHSADLIVPHPGIANRRFTLQPLVDIAPDYIHPTLKKTLLELLQVCDDHTEVKKIDL